METKERRAQSPSSRVTGINWDTLWYDTFREAGIARAHILGGSNSVHGHARVGQIEEVDGKFGFRSHYYNDRHPII